MQIQDKAYVVTTNYSKLSVRMPIDIDLSNISFCV